MMHQKDRSWPTQVLIFYGDAGSGKTRTAHDLLPNGYTLPKNNDKNGQVWFDNIDAYDGNIIIDDFYGWIKHDYMLQLMDRYKMKAQVKGSMVDILPYNIIITSNNHPLTWYPKVWEKNPKHKEAFFRRVTGVYHFTLGQPAELEMHPLRQIDNCELEAIKIDYNDTNYVRIEGRMGTGKELTTPRSQQFELMRVSSEEIEEKEDKEGGPMPRCIYERNADAAFARAITVDPDCDWECMICCSTIGSMMNHCPICKHKRLLCDQPCCTLSRCTPTPHGYADCSRGPSPEEQKYDE